MKISLTKFVQIVSVIGVVATVAGLFVMYGAGSATNYTQRVGITTGTVNIGKISRSVTDEVIKELHMVIPKGIRKAIHIGYRGDDSESREFAYKIRTYLQETGHFVEGMNTIFAVPKHPDEINLVEESDDKIVIFIESQTQY